MQLTTIFVALSAVAAAVANPVELDKRITDCGRTNAITYCDSGSRIPFPYSRSNGCFPPCYSGPGLSHTFTSTCVDCINNVYSAAAQGSTNPNPPLECQTFLTNCGAPYGK